MDTVKLEKQQALKKYHKIQLTQTIFQYCLTFMVVILCLSKSIWIMSLCFAIKSFFRSTLPCLGAYIMTPKCLFVLCNVIIVILVGESKLVGSASPPSTSDVYDEYVRQIRNQSLKRKPMVQQKLLEYSADTCSSRANIIVDYHEEKVMDEEPEEEDPQNDLQDKEEEEEVEKQVKEEQGEEIEGESEEEEQEQEKLGDVQETSNAGEDDNYLLVDELNKRVEDFIAKVNKQRRIEADMLLCGG